MKEIDPAVREKLIDYESRAYDAWQEGMSLLEMKDYSEAYDSFVDGMYICLKAMQTLPFPKQGEDNPLLPVMDKLYAGCRKAALEDEGGTLEEIFYEDGVHDVYRQIRKK